MSNIEAKDNFSAAQSGLVDNLDSESVTEGLTANQGRILKNMIPVITMGPKADGYPANPVNNQIHIMY